MIGTQKTIFSAFFLLVFLASCKKILHKESTITGTAIAINDGQPLYGYEAMLIETEISSKPFSPISTKIIATDDIDANGQFVFDSDLNKRSKFEYSVKVDTRDMYFSDYSSKLDGLTISEAAVEKEKDQILDIKLAKAAYFRIFLYNQNPFDENDSIKVFLDNGAFKGQYAVFGGYETDKYNDRRRGETPLTTLSGDIAVEWHVKRNGQTTVFYDTVFIPQSKYGSEYYNDAFVYEVHY